MRRLASARPGFRPLPRPRLLGRQQALPALGHPIPGDFGLEVSGRTRHAAALVGVLAEFSDDVHVAALQVDGWTLNARRGVGFPTRKAEKGETAATMSADKPRGLRGSR
jgi:hypothetical protein